LAFRFQPVTGFSRYPRATRIGFPSPLCCCNEIASLNPKKTVLKICFRCRRQIENAFLYQDRLYGSRCLEKATGIHASTTKFLFRDGVFLVERPVGPIQERFRDLVTPLGPVVQIRWTSKRFGDWLRVQAATVKAVQSTFSGF
jgi:hypothetical protein